MPYQEINRFLVTGGGPGGADITYIVTADFDTKDIYTYNDPLPFVGSGPTVDALTLGFNAGDVVSQRCVGTTLRKVTALFNYPYAQFAADELNSPSCGYTPPGCNVDYSVTVLNAVNGDNNGKITITVNTPPSAFYTFSFSLDGVTYQNNNVFASLFPGNYTIWVKQYFLIGSGRQKPVCIKYQPITVGNNVIPVSDFKPIPWQDQKDICWFFKLITDVEYEISEPIGWGDVNMKGERDPDYHGYNFNYTDGQTKLKFDCAAGKDIIKNVYDANGGDGDIEFQFGYTYKGTNNILFKGRLMLHTLNKGIGYVECTIENSTFDSVFQSRMETKVSMGQLTTFDKSPVLAPVPYDLELHAKETLSQFKAAKNTTVYYSDGSFPQDQGGHFCIMADVSEPQTNDLQQSNTNILQSLPGLPEPASLWNHKFDSPGVLNFALNWSVNAKIGMRNKALFAGKDLDIQMVFVHRKFNPADNSFTSIRTVISNTEHFHVGAFNTIDVYPNLVGVHNLVNYNVGRNDEIYYYIDCICSDTLYLAFWEVFQTNISVSSELLENAGNSRANVWFLDDAIRHVINVISDNKYVFKSNLLERLNAQVVKDGAAAKRVLTNGYQIRRFAVNDRPLQIDFKTLISSQNAQNCIGVNYTTDRNGFSFARIERRDFFYQDREILAIYEVDDYSESVATELIYNEYEIGYKSYKSEGFNSLDEFNTKNSGLTPIKKNPKKLSIQSDISASGYLIESVRRLQFTDKPTNSDGSDDTQFMITVKRNGAVDWVTEKNESFATVDNLISPATAYNLRLSPKRMLYNWFIWLKGIFAYKLETDEITVTEAIQNCDLETQFNAEETDVIGDLNKSLIQEKRKELLSAMGSTKDIYRPEWVNFTCRLSPDQVQIINAALSGTYGSTKDYGYLMVKKPDGIWQAGWVYDLTYNWWKQKLTIKMLKKFSSPAEPQAGDCCEWLVNEGGCYIKANGIRLIA